MEPVDGKPDPEPQPEAPEWSVNCDNEPFVPEDRELKRKDQPHNVLRGRINLRHARLSLQPAPASEQSDLSGTLWYTQLARHRLPGAQLFDHYIANPQLIPAAWRQIANGQVIYILFLGTIFRSTMYANIREVKGVRCLYLTEGNWQPSWFWLDRELSPTDYALVLEG